MDWLTDIAKHHEEWVKIVRSFGEYNYHEDIVQETYIRLHQYSSREKLYKDGVLQRGYIWIALKNTHILYLKSKEKKNKVSLGDNFQVADENNVEQKEAQGVLDQIIKETIESWCWYDAMLFNLYKDTDLSLRDIADKTNISLTSIFNTITNCKQRLKEAVGEHYQDYKNEDYERNKSILN